MQGKGFEPLSRLELEFTSKNFIFLLQNYRANYCQSSEGITAYKVKAPLEKTAKMDLNRDVFGLTISETLWKEIPVMALNVGGTPLQINDGENGFLVNPYDIQDCAKKVITLLENQSLAGETGKKGKDVIRKNFLITGLVQDYLHMQSQIPL